MITFRSSDRVFSVRTGSEGPRHDPYSYREYTVAGRGTRVLLHLGLISRLEVDGRVVSRNSSDCEQEFQALTGLNSKELERIADRVEQERYRADPESAAYDQAMLSYAR